MKNSAPTHPRHPRPNPEAGSADGGESFADIRVTLDKEIKVIRELRALVEADLVRIAEDRVRIAEDNAALDKKISDEVKRAEGFRDSLARAAEDAFALALKPAMAEHGIELDEVLRRVRIVNHGREVDILGLNGSVAVVGEVKIRLERDDVHKFADQLRDFREHFPEHARKTVYGVVAGETIDENAVVLARKRGFFILRMDGGIVCPETGGDFRPRAY